MVSLILILLGVSIYYLSADYREKEFYQRLHGDAITTARLFGDVEEMNSQLLKIIDKNVENLLPDEEVVVYDVRNKLLFSSVETIGKVPSEILEKVKTGREIRYKEGEQEVIGLLFAGKHGKLVVVAKALDRYGLSKLIHLRNLLIIVILIAIVLTAIAGYFFARGAIEPISNVMYQVDRISATNLNLRVNEGNGSDEIAQLAIKFNRMLERLEAAFEVQRSFVANASHELRTPLTVLTGNIEVAIMNNVDPEAREILRSLLEDMRQLNKLSNGLLDLAQSSLDISQLSINEVRIDEVIGNARAEILKHNKDYTVELNFSEFPESEKWLVLTANEQLIKSALTNVIENACKYSQNSKAMVNLSFDRKGITIEVTDTGIGISERDLGHIFEPFYRSSNVKDIAGHGIGLTLASKIVQLHKGEILLNSVLNKGTRVQVVLPHL